MPLPTLHTPRDHVLENLSFINNDVVRIGADDQAFEQRFGNLGMLYPPEMCRLFDIVSVGTDSLTAQFAGKLRADLDVHLYVDLGTGSGMAAAACIQRLTGMGQVFDVTLVDGLRELLDVAQWKILRLLGANTLTNGADLRTVHTDCHNPQLPGRLLAGTNQRADLITAERLFNTCLPSRRLAVLRDWASCLAPNGQLVVDVTHPRREVSLLTVSLKVVTPFMVPSVQCAVYNIALDSMFEDCRIYAQDLARAAGLQIINTMPAVLPNGVQDGRNAFDVWQRQVQSPSVMGPLSLDQLDWYRRRYVATLREHNDVNPPNILNFPHSNTAGGGVLGRVLGGRAMAGIGGKVLEGKVPGRKVPGEKVFRE